MTLGPQAIGIGPQEIGGGGGSANSAKRELIFTARSTAASQNPTALDTPLQVEFGPAQGGVNTPLQIDASGNVTVNESGTYYLTITLQTGRVGASGISMVYGRLLVDGVQAGGSVLAELDNANIVIPLQFNVFNDFTQGQIITVEIYRDAGGNNSGGLVEGIPSLSGSGWSNAETATVTASRLIPATQGSSTPVQDRSNYVLVKQKSDFPNPSGGVITLLSNTDYEINGLINLGNDKIALNGSNVIFGENPELDILLTNNAQALIEGRDAGAIIDRLSLINPSGPIFDVADVTTPSINSLFVTSSVLIDSISVGIFKDLQIVQFEKCAFQSLNNGVSFDGIENVGIRFNGNIVENTVAGTLIDLGASVAQAISMDHNFIESSAGLVFLSGASGGANVATNGQASVISNTTFGGNLPTLSGITTSDFGWEFDLNNTIPDSDRIGSLYMTNNIVPTTFLAALTPTKVLGTTIAGTNIQRFSMSASNQLTYDDLKTFNTTISYSVTVVRTSGTGNRLVRFYIYKNGALLVGSTQALEVDNRERTLTIIGNDLTSNGDYYELWISNEDNTNDMTVTELSCSIN